MKKHGQRVPLRAAIASHEVGARVEFANVVFVAAGHSPVAFARGGAREDGEVDAVGSDHAVLQRADDLIIAAGERKRDVFRHDVAS